MLCKKIAGLDHPMLTVCRYVITAKTMSRCGVIKNKITEKIGFALYTLQLTQSTWWRDLKNGFNFERGNGETLLENYESQ